VREVGVFGAFTVEYDANLSRILQVRSGLSRTRGVITPAPRSPQHSHKPGVARDAALWRYDNLIELPVGFLTHIQIGMAASRVGLWSFDLIQVKQLQETLANHPRRNTLCAV
jgi:hypothetical protein